MDARSSFLPGFGIPSSIEPAESDEALSSNSSSLGVDTGRAFRFLSLSPATGLEVSAGFTLVFTSSGSLSNSAINAATFASRIDLRDGCFLAAFLAASFIWSALIRASITSKSSDSSNSEVAAFAADSAFFFRAVAFASFLAACCSADVGLALPTLVGAIFVSAWNLLSWFYPQKMPDQITLIGRAVTFESFEYGTCVLSHWR